MKWRVRAYVSGRAELSAREVPAQTIYCQRCLVKMKATARWELSEVEVEGICLGQG